MSKSGGGGFKNFKGADLLAKLKTTISSAITPSKVTPLSKPAVEDELRAAVTRRPPAISHSKKPAPKPKTSPGKKPITILKFRNSTERERAVATARAASLPPPEAPKQKVAPRRDFGEAAFKKLDPYRQSLDGFLANHQGPLNVSNEDNDLVAGRVSAGAKRAEAIVDADDGYFLGYDFGTSTTKVVARYPYGGVDEAFAIDVPPSVCSDGHAHLWPTAVWWNPLSGRFSLTPEDGSLLLDSFKQALLQGKAQRICKGSGLTMMEVATAFVALHLAYTLGAALDEEPGFRLASINAGVPVAFFAGQSNVGLFERVLDAATCLVAHAPDLTIEAIRKALVQKRPPALPYTRHAELSGAIAGYCAAPRFYVGGHMIIDCGSATLDMATFDLGQRSQAWPIGIYAALVENLGADACQTFLDAGVTVDECRHAARYEEYLVFREALKWRPALFGQEAQRFPYQIILIGGGIHSEVHEPFLKKLESVFARPFHRPAVATTLRYDKRCEAGRLILADGLARDPWELKDVAMPTSPPPVHARDVPFVGPEQT